MRFWTLTLSLLLIAEASLAQVFDRPADQPLELPPFEPPGPQQPVLLPPIPLDSSWGGTRSASSRLVVRGFEVRGSTIYTEAELRPLLEPYIGQQIGTDELVEIRNAVTELYVDAGYINSGALIPDQDPSDGIIVIQVVEGSLEGIDVTGMKRFRKGVLRRRLAVGLSRPLNVKTLERNLQVLQHDPRIDRVHARLAPGERMGEAVLQVRVEEASPYVLNVATSNYSPVAFGAYRGRIFAAHRNLLGFGDTLSARFTAAEGLIRVDGQYEFPLNGRGTLLTVGGEYSDSEIVEDDFEFLDIETEYWSAQVGLEHPLYRSERSELRVGVLAERRRSKTCFNLLEDWIGCDPFSFLESGADDGEVVVSMLRFTGDWVWRDQKQVFAARSTLSVGLPVLGASSGHAKPDGEFVAWLGQLQWARRFPLLGIQTILRVDAQLTSDAVPSLERFPVGGHGTVRGYRENQLVRDQGVVASVEVRVPLLRDESGRPILEIAPFYDYGYSTNKSRPTPGPDTLASVGVGLRWSMPWGAQANVYWGHQLDDVPTSGDLQDDGVQFQISWDAF